MVKWIDVMRQRYAGLVIRRTVWSVDNDGKRISGLEPFHEHHIVVKLYDKEMNNLECLAQELIKDGTHKAAQAVAGKVSFCSSVRFAFKSLICYHIGVLSQHPSCPPTP
jgi:hypothetical protein